MFDHIPYTKTKLKNFHKIYILSTKIIITYQYVIYSLCIINTGFFHKNHWVSEMFISEHNSVTTMSYI